jgi:hypothetical protein
MAAVAHKIEEPKAELISISEIAKRLKLDRATVRSRLEDLGYEPDPSSTAKNQLFPFDGEMEFAIKAAKDTFTAVNIRDKRASAELKELKLAEARGELVPMAETIELVQAIVGNIYQEITVRQPKRIGPQLAKAKNVTVVRQILKKDTDKIMQSLRTNFEQFIESGK